MLSTIIHKSFQTPPTHTRYLSYVSFPPWCISAATLWFKFSLCIHLWATVTCSLFIFTSLYIIPSIRVLLNPQTKTHLPAQWKVFFETLEVQRKRLPITEIQQISVAKINSMSTPNQEFSKLLLHHLDMGRCSFHLMGSKTAQALPRSGTV